MRIRCLEGKKWKQVNLGEKKTREEKQSKVLTLALLEYTYGLCLNFEVKSELHTLLCKPCSLLQTVLHMGLTCSNSSALESHCVV